MATKSRTRPTVFDYNRAKIQLRLKHHPDCKGATITSLSENEMVIAAENGTRILVDDKVDWYKDVDGKILDKDLMGAMRLIQCLLKVYRTVDTEAELADMVCELYEIQDLKGSGEPLELLKEAMMWVGLEEERKIGFRKGDIPMGLKGKCQHQLSYFMEKKNKDWNWCSLSWIPLKELVKLASTVEDIIFTTLWKDMGPSSYAKDTLFRHYQRHGKLANRYAVELQRRVIAWDKDGLWPEVA